MIRIELLDWDAARADAVPVRFDVFVGEQRVPAEIELDEQDAHSLHAVAYDASGLVLGTGRLLPAHAEAGRRVAHIGRMAVQAGVRGTGVGSAILLRLMDAARERGDDEIVLSAQTHAIPFYRRHGFVEEGEVYQDAGIPHRTMRRIVANPDFTRGGGDRR